jgi:hypothetical protein
LGKSFEKAVNNVFESELRPLGFKLRQEFKQGFIAENDYLSIGLYDAYMHGCVFAVLFSSPKHRVGDMGICSYDALDYLAPEVPEKLRYPNKGASIEKELLRQVQLITSKLGMLIRGDQETWHKLRRWVDTGRGMRQRFNESDDQYLDRVRESLESALKNKEYWKAGSYFSLLSNAQGGLSFKDHVRRWLASQHTYMLP